MAEDKRIEIFEIEIKNLQTIDELNAKLAEARKIYKSAQEGSEAYNKAQSDIVSINAKLADHKAKLKEVDNQSKANDNTVEGLRAKYKSLSAEIVKTDLGTGSLSKEYITLDKEARKVSDRLKELESGFGQNQRNVGNYTASIKEAIAGSGRFGNSIVSLGQVLLTNPLGLIVTSLTGLVALFQQNDEAATFFSGVMKGLGATISVVSSFVVDLFKSLSPFADTISDIGTRIFNSLVSPFKLIIDLIPAVAALFKGEFSEAADLAGEAAKTFGTSLIGLNDELPEYVKNALAGVKAGTAFSDSMDELERKTSVSQVTLAKLNQTIAVNEKALRNTTLTYEEQIKILDKIQKADEQRAKIKLSLIDDEIKANKAYLAALGEGSIEQEAIQFKLNELEAKRIEAQTESLALQTRYEARREQYAEAESKRIEALLEKEQGYIAIRRLASEEQLELSGEIFAKEKENIDESSANFQKNVEEDARKDKESEDKKTEATKKAEADKKAARQAGFSFLESTFSRGASLAEEGSDLQKGLAITAATIATYESATKAYSSLAGVPYVGPALGAAAAAAAVAFGVAQIAQISAAAGGGDFVTTKPTLLLVGDNPGGRERVTVEPLSGRGQTRVSHNSGLVAMAGGGSLTFNGSGMAQVGNSLGSDITDQAQINKALKEAFRFQKQPVVSVVDIKKVTKKTDVTESRATLRSRA